MLHPSRRSGTERREGTGRATAGRSHAAARVLLVLLTAVSWFGASDARAASEAFPRVPPRMTLVVVPLDGDAASRGSCELLARLGERTLGLPASKVIRVARPGAPAEILGLFAPTGAVSRVLGHRDLLLVAFCGGAWNGPVLRLASGRLPLKQLVSDANRLVFPRTDRADAYFRGSLALIFDGVQDISSAAVPDEGLRNTMLLAWGSVGARTKITASTAFEAAAQVPALGELPATVLSEVVRDGERYRAGALLFTLAVLDAVFDRQSGSIDLGGVAARAQALATTIAKVVPAVGAARPRLRRGPGAAPQAFPVVAKDVRVFVEHYGASRASAADDPAAAAASLFSTYLSIEAGDLLGNGQGVLLVDESTYDQADVTCTLIPYQGRINVFCTQTDGVTLVEQSYDPKEFEGVLPDLGIQLLKQYMTTHSEVVDLVLEGRPHSVLLLVDRSWSSAFTDPTNSVSKAIARRDSIRKMAFLRIASELFHPSRPRRAGNRLQVVFFAGESEKVTFEGADIAREPDWASALASLSAAYDRHAFPQLGTDIVGALTMAGKLLDRDLDTHDCDVVLFTDGVDTDVTARRLAKELVELQRRRARIHVVGLVPRSAFLDMFQLSIARDAGGLERYVRAVMPPDQASTCLADQRCLDKHVRTVQRYSRVELDWAEKVVARTEGTAYAGVFARTTDSEDLTTALEHIFAAFRGRTVLATVPSAPRAGDADHDIFTFTLEDEGDYEFVISNQAQLDALRFTAPLDGHDATDRLQIDASNPTETVVRIHGPVRGTWTLSRSGGSP